LALLVALPGGFAAAQGARLAMLDRLDPGMWELRMYDGGRTERLSSRMAAG
jgi:hypothetical protein